MVDSERRVKGVKGGPMDLRPRHELCSIFLTYRQEACLHRKGVMEHREADGWLNENAPERACITAWRRAAIYEWSLATDTRWMRELEATGTGDFQYLCRMCFDAANVRMKAGDGWRSALVCW